MEVLAEKMTAKAVEGELASGRVWVRVSASAFESVFEKRQ